MPRTLLRWSVWTVLAAVCSGPAQAGEPVAGVNGGVAVPISAFRQAADLGGAFSLFAGYRIGLFSGLFTIMPLLDTEFAFMPREGKTDGVIDIFAFTAGGRVAFVDGNQEVFFQAGGGYYHDLNGNLPQTGGGGFQIGGGYNYEFWEGTALGVFIRRDEADIDVSKHNNQNLIYLVGGLSLRHRFLPPPPPPPPPPVAQAPPPPPPPVQKKIVLRGVNFDFDKADIRPDARPILDEAARILKEEPNVQVEVQGHTDSIGSAEYNLKLSLRRAEAVRDYLVSRGIAASRMTVQGFGKANPVASNETADGRAQNRRVELKVMP